MIDYYRLAICNPIESLSPWQISSLNGSIYLSSSSFSSNLEDIKIETTTQTSRTLFNDCSSPLALTRPSS